MGPRQIILDTPAILGQCFPLHGEAEIPASVLLLLDLDAALAPGLADMQGAAILAPEHRRLVTVEVDAMLGAEAFCVEDQAPSCGGRGCDPDRGVGSLDDVVELFGR